MYFLISKSRNVLKYFKLDDKEWCAQYPSTICKVGPGVNECQCQSQCMGRNKGVTRCKQLRSDRCALCPDGNRRVTRCQGGGGGAHNVRVEIQL